MWYRLLSSHSTIPTASNLGTWPAKPTSTDTQKYRSRHSVSMAPGAIKFITALDLTKCTFNCVVITRNRPCGAVVTSLPFTSQCLKHKKRSLWYISSECQFWHSIHCITAFYIQMYCKLVTETYPK